MLTALEGLTGVTCLMDDILIYGSNQQHDERLIAVLEKLQKFYVTLKKEKCVFNKFCEVPGSCN